MDLALPIFLPHSFETPYQDLWRTLYTENVCLYITSNNSFILFFFWVSILHTFILMSVFLFHSNDWINFIPLTYVKRRKSRGRLSKVPNLQVQKLNLNESLFLFWKYLLFVKTEFLSKGHVMIVVKKVSANVSFDTSWEIFSTIMNFWQKQSFSP